MARRHPGSRPSLWWRYKAREPLRQVCSYRVNASDCAFTTAWVESRPQSLLGRGLGNGIGDGTPTAVCPVPCEPAGATPISPKPKRIVISSRPMMRISISFFAVSAGRHTSRPPLPKLTPRRSFRTCCAAGTGNPCGVVALNGMKAGRRSLQRRWRAKFSRLRSARITN